MVFIKLHDTPSNIKRLQLTIGKNLDKINLSNYQKFLEEEAKAGPCPEVYKMYSDKTKFDHEIASELY